nr:YfhO family protein [Acetobacter malorum]
MTFDGITPNRPGGQFFLAETLAKRPEVFEKLGVALALVPHGFALPGSEALAPENRMQLIYADPTADMYRLPHAAPYFEAGSGCSVQAHTQTEAQTQCAAPSFLIRRELMMAGWTASVNGQTVVPTVEDGLFELIPLPAGQAAIRFSFTPPFMAWGWAGFLAGLALLALGFAGGRQMRGDVVALHAVGAVARRG